jgi:hypothetical protein
VLGKGVGRWRFGGSDGVRRKVQEGAEGVSEGCWERGLGKRGGEREFGKGDGGKGF